MKFYLSDTKESKEIEIYPWTGSGYGSECFDDLETNFANEHDIIENSGEIICTSIEYENLFNWWKEEILCMSAHGIGQNGDDYTELYGNEFVICEI